MSEEKINELVDLMFNFDEKELEKETDFLKEYKKLKEQNKKQKEILDKIKEYIEHENFKRNILLGLSEKKYTRDILNHILEMIEETK